MLGYFQDDRGIFDGIFAPFSALSGGSRGAIFLGGEKPVKCEGEERTTSSVFVESDN